MSHNEDNLMHTDLHPEIRITHITESRGTYNESRRTHIENESCRTYRTISRMPIYIGNESYHTCRESRRTRKENESCRTGQPDACRPTSGLSCRPCHSQLSHVPHSCMGWLRLVGSLKLLVSFAKEPYERGYILQRRHVIFRSSLIGAIP